MFRSKKKKIKKIHFKSIFLSSLYKKKSSYKKKKICIHVQIFRPNLSKIIT